MHVSMYFSYYIDLLLSLLLLWLPWLWLLHHCYLQVMFNQFHQLIYALLLVNNAWFIQWITSLTYFALFCSCTNNFLCIYNYGYSCSLELDYLETCCLLVINNSFKHFFFEDLASTQCCVLFTINLICFVNYHLYPVYVLFQSVNSTKYFIKNLL